MSASLRLGDILDGWPADLGETLFDLVNQPVDSIRDTLKDHDPALGPLVWALRAQAVELVRGGEREAALAGPQQVERALRDGLLRPRPDWWIIYPLDSRMRRVAAPHKQGGSRFALDMRKKFPYQDDVTVVSEGGAYLGAWGGTPKVLEIPGVAERIINFANTRTLTDVCFWDATAKTVWSLRFAVGQSAEGTVEFPTHPLIEKARTVWH